MAIVSDYVVMAAVWLGIIGFLTISLTPWLKKTMKEYAFPVSGSASLLIFAIISWYLGTIGYPVILALVPFVILFILNILRGEYKREDIAGYGKWIFVFLVFFTALLVFKYENPPIDFAEKFMDHAFLASIMRTPVAPPVDPWFIGGHLNVYYYLGYWLLGMLGIVSGVPSQVVFNLSLPTIFGLTAVNLFLIGHFLLQRFRYLPILTLLLVNPAFIVNIIKGKPWGSVMWDSTRTITDTIHEFPLFSFLWGDVHPHVIGLFNTTFLIALLVYTYLKWENCIKRDKYIISLLVVISLGTMGLMNTWDALIFGPITVITAIVIAWRQLKPDDSQHNEGKVKGHIRNISRKIRENWKDFLILGIIVPVTAVLLFFPYYLQIEGIELKGVFPVQSPTAPEQFLLVNGFFIAILVIYLLKDIIRRPYIAIIILPFLLLQRFSAAIILLPILYLPVKRGRTVTGLLAFFGLAVLLFCEFFYLKDSFGDSYYKMNTIFKFYYAAWVLLGISCFIFIGEMLSNRIKPLNISPRIVKIIICIVALGLIISPVFSPEKTSVGHPTLDGIYYLSYTHPEDYEGILFLKSQNNVTGVAEAIGDDYSYFSRVSSLTGIPTILGESGHEVQWRGDDNNWYGERLNDVQTMYEDPSMTSFLMEKYGISHLFIGENERSKYNVSDAYPDLVRVFNRNNVEIYQRPAIQSNQ